MNDESKQTFRSNTGSAEYLPLLTATSVFNLQVGMVPGILRMVEVALPSSVERTGVRWSFSIANLMHDLVHYITTLQP